MEKFYKGLFPPCLSESFCRHMFMHILHNICKWLPEAKWVGWEEGGNKDKGRIRDQKTLFTLSVAILSLSYLL